MILILTMDANLQSGRRRFVGNFAFAELEVEQEKISTITQVKCGNNVSGGCTDQTRNDPTLISVSAKHAYKYQPCTDQLSDLVQNTAFCWELCYRALWLDRRRFSHKVL